MKSICKNCAHWKNQNNPDTSMPIVAMVANQEVGACWKLQRSMVKDDVTELSVKDNKIYIAFAWPITPLYTVESFGCIDFTERQEKWEDQNLKTVRRRTK